MIDDVIAAVGNHYLDPAFDHVQRAGWKIVPGLVIGQDDLEIDDFARRRRRWRDDFHANHRALGPPVCNLGNLDLTPQPLFYLFHMLFGALQFQQQRNVLVTGRHAVATVFAIVQGAIEIAGITASRVRAAYQKHVALATGDGFLRLTFMMPAALFPAVILVLSLDLADVCVDFLVDVLFVAGRAKLRRLVQRSRI